MKTFMQMPECRELSKLLHGASQSVDELFDLREVNHQLHMEAPWPLMLELEFIYSKLLMSCWRLPHWHGSDNFERAQLDASIDDYAENLLTANFRIRIYRVLMSCWRPHTEASQATKTSVGCLYRWLRRVDCRRCGLRAIVSRLCKLKRFLVLMRNLVFIHSIWYRHWPDGLQRFKL